MGAVTLPVTRSGFPTVARGLSFSRANILHRREAKTLRLRVIPGACPRHGIVALADCPPITIIGGHWIGRAGQLAPSIVLTIRARAVAVMGQLQAFPAAICASPEYIGIGVSHGADFSGWTGVIQPERAVDQCAASDLNHGRDRCPPARQPPPSGYGRRARQPAARSVRRGAPSGSVRPGHRCQGGSFRRLSGKPAAFAPCPRREAFPW